MIIIIIIIQIRMKKEEAHHISINAYHNVKAWYELTKQNQFSQPYKPKEDSQHNQLYYIYSFKRIILNDKYVSKHIKQIGHCATNGLIIIANIYDQAQQYYLGKPYQQKGLFCQPNINENYIQIMEHVILSFYLITQKNIVKFGYCFVIHLQLVNNDGEIFPLGTVRHNLTNRPKNSMTSLTITKDNDEIGFIECMVDTPDKLHLSGLLPPCRIIDQKSIIPPCEKVNFLHKVNPLKIGQCYGIGISSLYITVEQVSKMLLLLKRKSNLYNRYHSSQINMQVTDYYMLLGYHNSWQFVKDSSAINSSKLVAEKQKEKIKGNKSNVKMDKSTKVDKVGTHSSFVKAKLIHNMKDNDTLLLSLRDHEHPQLNYFTIEGGQIICLLCVGVKFSVEQERKNAHKANIKEEIYNLGWSPLIFNTNNEKSTNQLPMITNISIPQYPILSPQLQLMIQTTVLNPNPSLHKIGNKGQYKGLDKEFTDLVMDMKQQIQTDAHYNLRQTKSLINQSKKVVQDNKYGKMDQSIEGIMQIMQKKTKNRLRMIGKPFLIPPIEESQRVNKHNIINKYIHFNIGIQSYIPHTTNLQSHYIPRQMKINLYLLRELVTFRVTIDSHTLNYGIAIPLEDIINRKMPQFSIQTKLQSSQELRQLQECKVICQIIDTQNYMYYGKGQLSIMPLIVERPAIFRMILSSGSGHEVGSFIFESCVQLKTISHNSHAIQQLQVKQIYKSLPMKERLMLRIANYQNSHNATTKKNEAITEYKKINKQKYATKISQQELGNDLQIQYEIGKPIHKWIPYLNENKSQNNLFTIQIQGCQFMELVTQRKQYLKEQVKTNEGPKTKGSLNYIISTVHTKGHYEVRIKHNEHIDLLLKVANNDWKEKTNRISIVHITLKRNTMHAKTFKIKLIYKPPIIQQVQNAYGTIQGNKSMITVPFPDQLIQKYNNFILPFSSHTYYDNKKQTISFQYSGQPQKYKQILIGFYLNKQYQQLIASVLFKVYIVEGERIRLKVGSYHKMNIPVSNKYKISDKIYRLQSSDQQCLFKNNKINLINAQQDQPQCTIRMLKPAQQKQLLVNVISINNQLIKQYMLLISATMPLCYYQCIRVQGYEGQQLSFQVRNPYSIKYRFFTVCSVQWLQVNDRQLLIDKEKKRRIVAKIVAPPVTKTSEYILIFDEQNKIIAIFQVQVLGRISLNILNTIVPN